MGNGGGGGDERGAWRDEGKKAGGRREGGGRWGVQQQVCCRGLQRKGGKTCRCASVAPEIPSSTLPRFTFPPFTLSPFLVQNAFKCYVRSRDYCTTSKHILSMCLSAIRAAVEMNNWMHVQNYVAKAEQTPDAMVRSVGGG